MFDWYGRLKISQKMYTLMGTFFVSSTVLLIIAMYGMNSIYTTSEELYSHRVKMTS